MIVLNGFPKNKDKYVRLIRFFKEIIDLCEGLDISPIVDGSLAVFAYSGKGDIEVNDIDTSIAEGDFPRIMRALEEKGIKYELKAWHVLQVLKDDLKIELGSLEYWLKERPTELETLKIGDREFKMLTLRRLKEFCWEGMEDRLKGTNPNDKVKYERLKDRYDRIENL